MDFGMPTFIEYDSLEENCGLCAKLGLNFVEINMNFPQYQLDVLDVDMCRQLKEKYGIYFTIHLPELVDVAEVNPKVRKAWLDEVLESIDFAREIEAPVINMHLNHGTYITIPDDKLYVYKKQNEEYRKNYEAFEKLCELRIGASGVKISIENTDGFLDFERGVLDHLLESPVFGLTWDIGHSISSDEKDMEYLLSHVSKLGHFHIHDGTRSNRGGKCHQELGRGEVNLESRLCLAKECKARCVVETKTLKSLENSVEWLRRNGKLD